jgi:heavy metal sensor kinase
MRLNVFKFTKISWKLTLLYASIFSLVLILLSAFVLYGIKFFLVNQSIQKVRNISNTIAERITEPAEEKMSLDDPELIGEARADATISVRIANSEGVLVNSEGRFKWAEIPFSSSLDSVKKVEAGEQHFVVENRPVFSDGRTKAYLQVAGSMEQEYLFLKVLFLLMAGADAAGIVLSLLAGYFVSRRMLFPIDRITKAAQSISINNLSRRIEASQADDELSRLAGTFNEMIDRLKQAFDKQNQFVSDASHELRTPISVIQGYIGLMDRWGKEDRSVLQEAIDAIKKETAGMTELIEKLLFLARGDSGSQKLQKNEFSLNELIEELYKESRLISQSHYLHYEVSGPITLTADRKMIKQALRALIDNSLKFTPPDGKITIRADTADDTVTIAVEDTGIGVPEEEAGNIFNRFYRVDKARSKESGGSGLGLSIAKWIVDVHGGSILAESTVGKGTVITIMLPRNTEVYRN